MRRLRVVMGGAAGALVVSLIGVEGCGSEDVAPAGDASVEVDAQQATNDAPGFFSDARDENAPDALKESRCGPSFRTYIVDLPSPGVPADPGQICAVSQPPASSNTAARVTLTSYSPSQETAVGFVALSPSLASSIVGLPSIAVASATVPAFTAMSVSAVAPTTGGYRFQARWPSAIPHPETGAQMTIKATFTVRCADGGTQTVESITKLDFCVDGESFEWVSSGDACTVCAIIAEMAPSPIVSDNRGDDLPLGRALRIRVVEIARSGRHVLLFAENDAGACAEYEWRVSGGAFERIADDVVLWTVPEQEATRPFGQVAVWNDDGAAVENFVWGAS